MFYCLELYFWPFPSLQGKLYVYILHLYNIILLLFTIHTFSVILVFRNLLYPCLSEIDTEDENTEEESSELSPVVVLEGDAIRLAGACFIAIALSSLGLLVPLLPCCQYVKNNTTKEDTSSGVGNQNTQQQLSNYFFLRTLLFMHGNVSLCLIAVGLVNLESSEDNNVYTDKLKCSSLKDNTILWMGVSMFALTSFGLMASFWPNTTTASSSREDKSSNTSQVVDEIANIRKMWCRRRRKQTNHALLELENIEEPLLSTEEQQQESNIGEQHNDSETSRLRGTERLLKLAGGEAHYLWVGIAVLLFRLPFSLAIPHFVSTTIASLIDEDFVGAKREVLLIFLIGSVDAVLDYWCIYLFGKAKENIVRSIRVDTFASILKQDFSFFDRTNTGDLISRLTSDCGEMAGDLTWFFRFSIEALVRITGISIYMIIRSPALGGCTLAIVPVVGIINKVYGDWLGKNAEKVQTALAKSTACAHESLSCIKTVITLGCEEHESKKYNTQIERLYDLSMKQLIVSGIYFMGVSTFLINTCVQESPRLFSFIMCSFVRMKVSTS